MGGRNSVQSEDETFDLSSLKAGDKLWSLYWHTGRHSFEEPQLRFFTVKSVDHIAMEKVSLYEPYPMKGEANTFEISFEEEDNHPVRYTVVTPPEPELVHSNYGSLQFKPMFWRSREEALEAARAEMTWARNNLIEEKEVLEREIAAIDKAMYVPFKEYER